jgi:hypothetical protein
MPNVSVNLSGAGVIVGDVNVTGAIVATGKVTANGFRSSLAGTLADAAYGFTTDVHASGPTSGIFHEGTRLAVGYNGTDKAYWGSVNHNYATINAASGVIATNTSTTAGNKIAVASKTATFTPTDTEEVLLCDPTSGAITVNLPTAVSGRQRYFIRKVNASANAVTIDPNGTQTIDGAATLVVANNTTVCIVSDGSNWHTLSST